MNRFFDAVENGDCRLVAELLESDPSLVNATDTRMFWPLGYSAKCRIKEEGTPAPKLRTRDKASMNSALHIAAANRQTEVARILIDAGARVDAAGDRSHTPLLWAVYYYGGPVSLELVALLIENGADVNAREFRGRTALHEAVAGTQDPRRFPIEVIELLLRHGADASARTDSGLTPFAELLALHACPERVVLARMLIRAGGLNFDHPEDGPLICLAARKNEPEMLRLLIEAGADVNRSDPWGTALHYAAREGLHENVGILLAAGADPCALDFKGRSPMEWIAPGLLEAMSILEEHAERTTE